MNSPISLANFGVLKRFLLILLTAAAILASVVFSLYVQDVRHQKAVQQNEALHVISLEQEFLTQEFRAVETDLLFLARQTSLSEFLTQDSPALRTKIENEYANFAAIKQTYDQIRCLDTDGQESVRINFRHGAAQIVPTSELQPKATRYYYQQALSLDKGDIFVSPFDLNVEHGQIQQPIKPVLRFLTPVFDQNEQKKGLLVLNYLGAKLLSKLSEISTGFRGETFLVNQDGEYLQANNPAYEWGWMQQHDHSFRQHFPDAWNTIQHESSGQFYQSGNQFTFQWVQPGEAFQDASKSEFAAVGFVGSTQNRQPTFQYVTQATVVDVCRHHAANCLAVSLLGQVGSGSRIARKTNCRIRRKTAIAIESLAGDSRNRATPHVSDAA
ncbi:MAG: cache domain-containing protein [Pirellulaceae bacterium]